MKNTLFSFLDSQQEQVINWQRELTVRPALGPDNHGQGEQEKADWLYEELRRMGLSDVQVHASPDPRVPNGSRPNISARVPGKTNKTLWVIGHMDIVPPGEESLWQSPPYTVRVEGDLIYGRGVEDNQQAIVTGLLAAKALLDNKHVPELSLGLLFVADEETGMCHGVPHVLEAAPDLIAPDDLILVPDMGNNDGTMVEIAEKSSLWLRVAVLGKQCHASTPEKGINSLVAASACVLGLEELYQIFPHKDPLYSPKISTFVPTKKEANVEGVNILPGQDVFFVDCRVLPEYTLGDVQNEVQRIVSREAARYHAKAVVTFVQGEQAPEATPPAAPVVQRLVASLRSVRGIEPVLSGAGGQTVAACLRRKGYDVAVWATLIPNPHVPNECSRISATIADAKIVLDMML